MTTLAEKYQTIQKECDELAGHPVKVIAVTKKFTAGLLNECLAAGIKCIGENQVQEALHKREELPPETVAALEWHFIGHLQSNKAKFIPGNFDYVHSIGSESGLKKLGKACADKSVRLPVLLQINTTGEESKSGFTPEAVASVIEKAQDLTALELRGFMTMGPTGGNEAGTEAAFQSLAKLRDDVASRLNINLPELSMGMSNDYRLGCRYGATMVRVGRVLFGERPVKE